MPETLSDIFAEDHAHAAFLTSLLSRLAADVGRELDIRVISARGGHPRVLRELAAYRAAIEKGALERQPELIVIASDTNCSSFTQARKALEQAAGAILMNKAIIACPDPHIERWYLADPQSFEEVVGVRPRLGKKKCDRNKYKSVLSKAVSDAGHPPLLGGLEFAPDLVAAMDLYRAGKTEKSLKHFVDGARARLRQIV